jgi:NhaP-type Na+/H+ or K+/H+ antiporter
MTLALAFGLTLFLAVLISERAGRTLISTSVLFLAVGSALGSLQIARLTPASVRAIAQLALVAILFTDGMKIGLDEIRHAWRLPGRALLLGLPLTLLLTAGLLGLVLGLNWMEAVLIAAILSPTDPVFASALIGNERVPRALRHLLNVESGMNDGLALPIVVGALSALNHGQSGLARAAIEVLEGIALGIATPWIAIRLVRLPFFRASPLYRPLFSVSVLLTVFSLSRLTGANPYLAAFSAGVTLATISEIAPRTFAPFGETLTELIKLAALLVFGAVVSWPVIRSFTGREWLAAALVLLLARPVALLLALWRSPLPARQRLAAAWFGPKGFASVVFALMARESGYPRGDYVFHVCALVIALSILLHSTTDVPVSRAVAEPCDARPSRAEPASISGSSDRASPAGSGERDSSRRSARRRDRS